jgi:hypothetical protein
VLTDRNCELLGARADFFDIINIARAFAGGEIQIEQPEVIRSNEYRKKIIIRLAWKRKRDAFLENFKKQTQTKKKENERNGWNLRAFCMRS